MIENLYYCSFYRLFELLLLCTFSSLLWICWTVSQYSINNSPTNKSMQGVFTTSRIIACYIRYRPQAQAQQDISGLCPLAWLIGRHTRYPRWLTRRVALTLYYPLYPDHVSIIDLPNQTNVSIVVTLVMPLYLYLAEKVQEMDSL